MIKKHFDSAESNYIWAVNKSDKYSPSNLWQRGAYIKWINILYILEYITIWEIWRLRSWRILIRPLSLYSYICWVCLHLQVIIKWLCKLGPGRPSVRSYTVLSDLHTWHIETSISPICGFLLNDSCPNHFNEAWLKCLWVTWTALWISAQEGNLPDISEKALIRSFFEFLSEWWETLKGILRLLSDKRDDELGERRFKVRSNGKCPLFIWHFSGVCWPLNNFTSPQFTYSTPGAVSTSQGAHQAR